MIRHRPYRGVEDMQPMQAVTAAAWRAGKPRVSSHIGDIPWSLYQHAPGDAAPKLVELFVVGGEVVGWAVLWLPQTCVFGVRPEAVAVVPAILDWFEGAAGEGVDGGLDVRVLASDGATISTLGERGYRLRADARWLDHRVRSLASPVDRPSLPDGYSIRGVTAADVERRVEVHRAAWEPSKFTAESYRVLRTLHPYREDLDLVVEAPDGSFVANAQVWLDAENGVGELEPVGTHPAHRRRGLASAVCVEACRRLRALGADTAVVYSVSDRPAGRVYEAIGFEVVDRHVEYRLPR